MQNNILKTLYADAEQNASINYQPDICKYFMQFRKCYNVRCYRIHLKGTMRKRSPQKQHQAPSHLKTNLFHKPYRPANSAFANKPQKTTSFFNPHNDTHTPINYNAYSHNPIPPYSHSWTSSSANTNSEQPLSPRHNLSRQHTTVQSPSNLPQYYRQNNQPIAKIQQNTHDHFSFLYKKIINLQHQLDNTAGENGSAKRRKQVYWGKNRINQWLFTKSKDFHKQQNSSRPTKITITSRDDHQQYQQLQPVKDNKECQGQQQQRALRLHSSCVTIRRETSSNKNR